MNEWDMCVRWIFHRNAWWWNAWRERTLTELSGVADSIDDANRQMLDAIEAWRADVIDLHQYLEQRTSRGAA